jgi:hypothetical protein
MEDVLDIYKRPYNERYPVICLDETTRQLIGETRTPEPAEKGKPRRYDYEYVRNGVAHLFVMFEPLMAKRFVQVTKSHTQIDFAYCLRQLAEDYYANAKKIILVLDNLRVHTLAALYLAFPPEKARALAERFEIHYTPKHASWLNMVEIEIGVLSRQCLNQRIPDLIKMDTLIQSWVKVRNEQKQKVKWQFTTKDARIKLQHLYPRI